MLWISLLIIQKKADLAIARYLNGVTSEIQQKERDEVLATTTKNYKCMFLC